MEEMRNKKGTIEKTHSKMAEVIPALSVATLNANGLNCLIKKQKLTEWISKTQYY